MSRLAIAVSVLAIAAAAPAATIRVDAGGQGDFYTIQEGIDASSNGDTVLVAAGTYTGPMNRALDFSGRLISLVGESGREATVVDCQFQDRAFIFDNGENLQAVVDGLTVRNGHGENGGAVWIVGAGPMFQNCAFENCSAGFGGAFYLGHQANPHIEYCEFDGNSANDYGGGVYTYIAFPYIYECDFTNNSAGISGGAISCKTWTVASIFNNRFTGNTAQDGGSIYFGTLFTSEDDDLSKSY